MAVLSSGKKGFLQLNLLDIIIIIVVLVVIAIGVFSFVLQEEEIIFVEMRLNSNPVGLGSLASRTTSYTVPIWLAETVNKGDTEIQGGEVIAEIVSVSSSPAGDSGRIVDLVVKLSVKRSLLTFLSDSESKEIFFKGRGVKINSSIEIETGNTAFSATVTRIFDEMPESREVQRIVELEVDKQPLFVIQNLRSGMKEQSITGETVAEITDFMFFSEEGKNVDLVLRARVSMLERGGLLFFKDKSVSIGKNMSISTEKVNLDGRIVDIFSTEQGNELISHTLSRKLVEVRLANQPDWILQSISIGAVEKDSKGQTLVEIIEKTGETTGENTMDVTLRAKVTARVVRGLLLFKGESLQIGNRLVINAGNLNLEGVVSGISDVDKSFSDSDLPVLEKIVSLRVSNITPWVARVVSVGDTELDALDEKTIFEVLSVISLPAERIVTSDTGDVLKRSHPVNKDLEITAKIQAVTDGSKTYFKGGLIRIGSWVWIDLGDVAFSAQITRIEG